mgnify:CR=1 FL=1
MMVPATLTYDGTERDLIATAAVVDPAGVPVEYALSEDARGHKLLGSGVEGKRVALRLRGQDGEGPTHHPA